MRQKQGLAQLANAWRPLTDEADGGAGGSRALARKALHEVFQSSLYEMLRKAVPEITEQEALAWRVFLGEPKGTTYFDTKCAYAHHFFFELL